MRPPKLRQSALRTPLNRILGTEANVRILRALSLDPSPVTRTELARRAGLEPKGAHLAAKRLLDEGILERVGSGAVQQVVLAISHPLADAIRSLFTAERERADRLVEKLRGAAQGLSREIDGAWIQGGFAADTDQSGEPVVLAVLAPAAATATLLKVLRQAVTPIERAEDVTIDTRVYTRADLLTLPAEDHAGWSRVLPLFGRPPASIIDNATPGTRSRSASLHSNREAEQRLLAEAIVRKLRRHPAKRRLALDYIERRWQEASAQERHELEEWKAILESASSARLERFLTDPGERATRLRQTLPFVNILSADERKQILSRIRHDSR